MQTAEPDPATINAERLDLEQYVPFFITAIANRWTATSSRTYLRRFGIGIVEWRILASLGARGVASSLDVVTLVGIDPASVSKAMRTLERRGFVSPVSGTFPGRTKPYEMTDDGNALFATMRDLAAERETVMLAPLAPAERAQLLALLSRVHAHLPALSEIA